MPALVAISYFAGARPRLRGLGEALSPNRPLTVRTGGPKHCLIVLSDPFSHPYLNLKVMKNVCDRLICIFLTFSACCFADGVAGALRGPLQPHHSLRPPHLLQLGAQTAIQELLLLLPAAHLQAEGSEAALRRRDSHYGHLQIHPCLQL